MSPAYARRSLADNFAQWVRDLGPKVDAVAVAAALGGFRRMAAAGHMIRLLRPATRGDLPIERPMASGEVAMRGSKGGMLAAHATTTYALPV